MLLRANFRNKKSKPKSDIKYTSIFISKEIVYFYTFSSYLTTAYKCRGVLHELTIDLRSNWIKSQSNMIKPFKLTFIWWWIRQFCAFAASSTSTSPGSFVSDHAGVIQHSSTEKQGNIPCKCLIQYNDIQKTVSYP